MANIIRLKRGEAKTITATVKNKNTGAIIDVSSATLEFVISEADDVTALVTVADGSFDKSDGANGIITFPLSTTNLDRSGSYKGELRIEISASNISKSAFLRIEIEDSSTS